ncbi:hypothetical protein AAKU61_004239 [Undibacterium sp. GrIS 1.2]
MTTLYKQKNAYEVMIRRTIIARMHIRHNGERQLRILQGMPREDTLNKLLTDCPIFCRENGINSNTYPLLFS